jgi:hypothetical protein
MSEVEQRREQLPSERGRQPTGAAKGGDREDALRRAQARRNAWLLGGLAVFFYVGYMVWIFIRSNGG